MIVPSQMPHPLAGVQLHGVILYDVLTAFQAPLYGDGEQMKTVAQLQQKHTSPAIWKRNIQPCFWLKNIVTMKNNQSFKCYVSACCNFKLWDIYNCNISCFIHLASAALTVSILHDLMVRTVTIDIDLSKQGSRHVSPRADWIMAKVKHNNGSLWWNSIWWLFCYDYNYSMSTW